MGLRGDGNVDVSVWATSAPPTGGESTGDAWFLGGHRLRSTGMRLLGLVRVSRHVSVVHLHSVFSPLNVVLSFLPPPFVITPHGGYRGVITAKPSMTKRVWLRFVERPLLRRARFVLALTEREAADIKSIEPRASVRVIHIPVPTVTSPVRRANARNVLFIGRLSIQDKGLDLLLEGWNLARSDSNGAKLTIVGPGTPGALSELTRLITKLNLEGTVQILPPVNSITRNELFSRNGWFVHTSRREGLPLAVLEAMAAGLPVVVTEDTNLDGFVRSRQCGIIAVPTTAEGVATALRTAFNTPEVRRREFGIRARKLVQTDFDSATITQDLIALYEEATTASTRAAH
jgi:glycosyltransferase involved in cell wall biosynthesis